MNMTEEQIEAFIERKMNTLDRQLLNDQIDQDEYDHAVYLLDLWAERQYDRL